MRSGLIYKEGTLISRFKHLKSTHHRLQKQCKSECMWCLCVFLLVCLFYICVALHTSRQFQLDGWPLTDQPVEEESCSHTPPGANTPGLPPMKSEAVLSYTSHSRDKGESGSTDEMYKKNQWRGKKCTEKNSLCQSIALQYSECGDSYK